MAQRHSLGMQLQSVMHCVAHAGKSGISPETLEAAEEGVESLRFLRDHRDAYVALQRILDRFPGATIGVETDGYHNGSGQD